MKTKTILLSCLGLLILAVAGAGVWWMLRPQVIVMDDGAKLTLLGVDYGKHHKTKAVARSFNTTNDTLVIWVRQQYDPSNWHNFQFYLCDKADTACVMGSETYNGNFRQGNGVVTVQFSAFPRRGGKFYVRVQENSNGAQEMSDQKFAISNPVRGEFPNWAAETLPDTEEDGDLSVTLKKLVAGVKAQMTPDGDDDSDPANYGAQAVFNVEINGTNASNWQPVAIETSDATSNDCTAFSVNTSGQGDDLATMFQYALWPDEPAWKLRVEFSKQSGFDNNELWVVPAIPLSPGHMQDFWNYGRRQNQGDAFAETDLQDLHLQIFPVKHFTDMPPNSQPQGGLTIEIDPPLPEGMRLTIVKLTDDQGNDLNHWDYGQNQIRKGAFYRFGLQDLDGVTNVNLTLAVHQSHFVEFTAKPETAQ